MAEEILRALEAATPIVLAPPNLIAQEQRQSAEAIFLNFRKTRSPFNLCRQILELTTTDYILFETVGLIKTALIQDWSVLSESDIHSLKQYLLHYIISKPTLAPYVRTRVLQMIAIIIKRGSVNNSGQERENMLDEIECLIINGDLSQKILGYNILFAIMKEYATTTKSADIGLTWETHRNEKRQFETTDLKRIFKFCVQALGEIIKKDFEESTLSLVKHILPIVENVLTWGFVYRRLSKTLVREFEAVYESGNNPTLKLTSYWRDVMLDPVLLDLFFLLYWKIRNDPQLAYYARNCLIQLASLNNGVFSNEEMQLQYITDYIQRFLKLISNIEIIDQEAYGIANIIKKIDSFFEDINHSLPIDMIKIYIKEITRLTCLFIEGASQEDSICSDECLYMDALECMLETWIGITGNIVVFPPEICKPSFIEIFNVYIRCHLSTPEGMRQIGLRSIIEEEIDIDEDDKVKFKEQLQVIGILGRQIPNHSLSLLAQLLEDRIHKLRDNLNKLVGEEPNSKPTPQFKAALMDDLYEDLHWLVLITGHVLCMESEGEVALIPSEIMQCSMEQVREGKIDLKCTLQCLMSSTNIHSDMSSFTELLDYVIRLTRNIFCLYTIEKIAVSVDLKNMLSPELSTTITWFLHRWSQNYLLLTESYYSEISPTFSHAFGQDTPTTMWITNFILDKVAFNIDVFNSEPMLMKETIKLLIALVETRTKAICVSKCEKFDYIYRELGLKMKLHFPSIVKRGIMRAIASVCNVKESASMYQYCKELVHTVALALSEYVPGSIYRVHRSFSYRDKNVIINSLECYIGISQGIKREGLECIYNDIYHNYLKEIPEIFRSYFYYPDVQYLIFELLSEYINNVVCYTSELDSFTIYSLCSCIINHCKNGKYLGIPIYLTAEDDYLEVMSSFMQLLIDLLSKNSIDANLNTDCLDKTTDVVLGISPSDLFFTGFCEIIPKINLDLLKFPSLCLRYFNMIVLGCEIHPDRMCLLDTKILQQILASVQLGLVSLGREIAVLCCDIIQTLAKHIYLEYVRENLHQKIMVPFLRLIMDLIMLHQINFDLISNISIPLYYLICCYQEEYQQLVQNILSIQTDQQIVQRLASAFTELTANVYLNISHTGKFKDNFDKFIVNVLGFLIIK